MESIKWKANLKWPRLILLLKIFHFWEFFNLGRPPMRIRPPEKSLNFSTSFDCAFEPSIIILSVSLSPHLQGSAFPNPTSFLVRLWALDHLQCSAFPNPHHLSSAPLSPHFLLSAPSSPHFLWALISWIVRLRALSCHPLKFFIFFHWQVTHYNVTNLKNPRIFSLRR